MFIKEKMTQFGIPAKYWKLGMITIDRNLKEASYSLNLYISPEAPNFIDGYTVSLLGMEDKTQYNEYFEGNKYGNIYAACYEHAKNHEEFF